MSITVTSATNFLSFMVGAITPFPCVRIFCLYTGISVRENYVMCYVNILTFTICRLPLSMCGIAPSLVQCLLTLAMLRQKINMVYFHVLQLLPGARDDIHWNLQNYSQNMKSAIQSYLGSHVTCQLKF